MHRDTEWDPLKAALNRSKHGVDFADAVAVLEDPFALTRPDEYPHERRFVTFGQDMKGRVIAVAWAPVGDRMRIISARLATRNERRSYEEDDNA